MQCVPCWLAFLGCVLGAAPPEKDRPRLTARAEPPTEWVDPATGHRVVRLSKEPGTSSLYFHQNPYTASGDKMVVTTAEGLSTINLKTGKIEPVVEGRRVRGVVVGRKTRMVFYTRGKDVYATHLDTHKTRKVATLPPELSGVSNLAVNADETMLVSSTVDRDGKSVPKTRPKGKAPAGRLEAGWAAGRPMVLYTIQVKTGAVKVIHRSNDWLNHVQCSPTDPDLIMFCHEGPWHFVDRIWTIRSDGTGLRKVHTRSQDMEIAGHEFFSADGKTIWFDLQTPKGKQFWLAGVVLGSGEKIRYKLTAEQWSVHFNQSPDGKWFAGDGGGPRSVAAPNNGQWIYLFTPENGRLKAEKLVDLSKHNYRLEPNVTFTPDGKRVVFRSNMHGATHVYAVDVRKAK
jgi:oligogalacturonide lyase